MAEVGYIFPEDAAKQVVAVGNAIKETDDKLLKYTEDASKLIALLKQQNISFEQLQKVQKEAVDTTTKLDAVGKQLLQSEEKLNQLADPRIKQIIKNRTETTKLTQALKDKLKANQAEEGSLVRMRAKLKELTEQYDKTGNRTNAATAEINKLSREIGRAELATNRGQRNVGQYSSAIQGLTSRFLGALGITSAIFIFANAIKNTFSKIKEFSKESAVLAGVLGKTRREITQLTEQAVQLGSIYPITATEVNKLQVSYARLGFTQSEIMQLTEATIQGSMALNSELDATATLVGAVVKAYDSLKTSDAPDIVDKLTVSTQKSSLSFSSLETALPKVAGAANALNIPLDKTLALLGVAQDATLDASISGTSLRNIFLEISARGITLNEALTQINSSQNKLNEAYDLFGRRGAIVGLALANNIEKTEELEKEINKAGGTAERVAKEQMATLDGSVSGMASSWEKLMLSFRNSEGVLKTMVGWFATAFDAISNMIDAQNNKNISFLNKSLLWFKGNSQQAIETALKQSLSKANRADVEFTIKNNEEKLKEGSKYEKNLLQLMYNRLDEIKKAEEKAAKESIALKEKEANEKALQELEKLKPEKLSKEDNASKKEAEKAMKELTYLSQLEKKLQDIGKEREKLIVIGDEGTFNIADDKKMAELETQAREINTLIADIKDALSYEEMGASMQIVMDAQINAAKENAKITGATELELQEAILKIKKDSYGMAIHMDGKMLMKKQMNNQIITDMERAMIAANAENQRQAISDLEELQEKKKFTLEAFSDFESEILKASMSDEEKKTADIEDEYNKRISLLSKYLENKIITEEQYDTLREKIIDDKLTNEVNATIAAGEKILEEKDKLHQKEIDQRKKNEEDFKNDAINQSKELANSLFQNKKEQLQLEFQAAEGNAKKQAEIKKKIAKQEKTQALFNIAVNTAVAISKVLGQTGIFGLAAWIPVAALGAVQSGIVMSQKIPEFAKGTDYAPNEFIAGEKGREIVKTKSGDVVMADKATHFKGNRFKGATVYTNRETEQIIEQSGRGNNFTFDTRELRDEMRAVKNAIVKKPIAITDNSGRVIGKQSNNYRETYLNRMQNGR